MTRATPAARNDRYGAFCRKETRLTMLRLIVLFGLFATTALLAAEPLTPQQFTARYAEAIAATYAGSTAKVIGDLDVKITSADKQSTQSFLDNAYKNYQANPEALDDVLQRYVAAVAGMLYPEPGNDIGRLFPVIKDNSYIAEIKAMLSQSKGHDPNDPFPFYFEQLNTRTCGHVCIRLRNRDQHRICGGCRSPRRCRTGIASACR